MWNWLTRRRSDMSILADRIDALAGAVATPATPSRDSDTTSERIAQIETDLQQLQLRQEQLAEECLRHLRKASQRLKRAEQIAEDEVMGEDVAPPAATAPQLPFPEQAEQDDIAWAREMIRNRGEIPI